MDINLQEYMINEYTYNGEENVGMGIIESEPINELDIDDDDQEYLFGKLVSDDVGGKDYVIPVIQNIFFCIIAVFCLSMKEKSKALPVIGIIILIILNFRYITEIDINVIFIIIPSILSMICAYGISFCKETILIIILFGLCIFVLSIIGLLVIDIKIHVLFVAAQIILAIVILYKSLNSIIPSDNIVIQKILESTTIQP